MHKKSFTFGVGAGLIIVALLLYGAYAIQLSRINRSHRNEMAAVTNELDFFTNAKDNALIEEIFEWNQILDWAVERGMVFASDLATPAEQTPPYDAENQETDE